MIFLGVADWWLFCPLCDQEAIVAVRSPDAARRAALAAWCTADPGPRADASVGPGREAVLRTASRPGHDTSPNKKSPDRGFFNFE
jgi:hypothetical protein